MVVAELASHITAASIGQVIVENDQRWTACPQRRAQVIKPREPTRNPARVVRDIAHQLEGPFVIIDHEQQRRRIVVVEFTFHCAC
ncbi:MAG: hypothetical protein H0X68_08025 [Chloroflexi bacterium]|nr:hypothetical protein [Chloroflexota bacterium]